MIITLDILNINLYYNSRDLRIVSVIGLIGLSKNSKNLSNPEYLKIFWVGLIDGDGTIFVNQSKKGYISLTIQIKLKITPANVQMLKIIQTVIGGQTNTVKSGYCYWRVINKKDIRNCLSVLNLYPPLTLRKNLQLEFYNNCITNPSYFLDHKDNKFNRIIYLPNYSTPTLSQVLHYFPAWFSGFTEAEGQFQTIDYKPTGAIRGSRFHIGQNNDYSLLTLIQSYLGSTHTIVKAKMKKGADKDPNHFSVSVGGKECVLKLLNHFEKYPLFGEKIVKYDVWKNNVKKLYNL